MLKFFYFARDLFIGSVYLTVIIMMLYPLAKKHEKFMMFVHRFTLFSVILVAVVALLTVLWK
jgi:hypothetical protein